MSNLITIIVYKCLKITNINNYLFYQQMTRNWYVIAALCMALSSTVHNAKFLAIFPSATRSHNIVLTALTRELARRGHHVTVISSFPEQPPVPNITDIEVKILPSEGCKFAVIVGLLKCSDS